MARVWEPPPEARWGTSSPRRGVDQAAAVVVILCPPRGQAAHATVVPHAHATLQPCPEMLAALFLHVRAVDSVTAEVQTGRCWDRGLVRPPSLASSLEDGHREMQTRENGAA